MRKMLVLVVLLMISLMNCGQEIIYKTSGEDTLYIDTENPIKTRSGSLVLSKNESVNFLQGINDSSFDILLDQKSYWNCNLNTFSPYLGGVQISEGAQAPFTGYTRSASFYRSGLTYNLPLQFFVLCRDNLHYCKVVLDSFELHADSSCTAYLQYTVNLEPNDTRF